MRSIEPEIKEFYETETYKNWAKENDPKRINGGVCGEFADFVCERKDDFSKMNTADILGVPEQSRPNPWHVWVTDGNLHYDAENPNGVSHWQRLNFFKRNL